MYKLLKKSISFFLLNNTTRTYFTSYYTANTAIQTELFTFFRYKINNKFNDNKHVYNKETQRKNNDETSVLRNVKNVKMEKKL